MKYRPSSPARANWHSSTIAKGTITIYTSWKSADVLWKFKSILLFLSCIFNCLIDTSRNWAPGVSESGISSPCRKRSGSLRIPHRPSLASPNGWGRVRDLGCDDPSFGVGHGGHSWWQSVERHGLSKRMWTGLQFSRPGLHRDEEPAVGKPLPAPDVLAGTARQLWCIKCSVGEGEIQPCCTPAVVRGDTSGMNLAQSIFYSSRCSRAATDTYGKKANTMKTPQTKAFHGSTDTYNWLVASCFGDQSLVPLAKCDVSVRVKPQPPLQRYSGILPLLGNNWIAKHMWVSLMWPPLPETTHPQQICCWWGKKVQGGNVLKQRPETPSPSGVGWRRWRAQKTLTWANVPL